MPLVVLCGQPCSGKSRIAAKLAEAFRALGHEVAVVDEPSLHLIRDQSYKDTVSEKNTRGKLRSAVERGLSQKQVVILDSLNNIKGYRYELWCVGRFAAAKYCMVHIDTPVEQCRQWNSQRQGDTYSSAIFEDLAGRFERPDPRNRWDAPLFTVVPGLDETSSSTAAAAVAAAISQPTSTSTPTSAAASASTPASTSASAWAPALGSGSGAGAGPGSLAAASQAAPVKKPGSSWVKSSGPRKAAGQAALQGASAQTTGNGGAGPATAAAGAVPATGSSAQAAASTSRSSTGAATLAALGVGGVRSEPGAVDGDVAEVRAVPDAVAAWGLRGVTDAGPPGEPDMGEPSAPNDGPWGAPHGGGGSWGETSDDIAWEAPPMGDALEGSQSESQVLQAIVRAMVEAPASGAGAGAGPDGDAAPGSMGRFVGGQAPQLTPSFATSSVPILATNTLHEIDQAAQAIITAIMDAQAAAAGGAAGRVRFGQGLPSLQMDQPVVLAELRRHKRAFLQLATKIMFARLQDAETARRMFIDYLRDNVSGASAAPLG